VLTRGSMYGVCGCMGCQASDESSISLSAGCDLFMRYVTRTSAIEYEDIEAGKARLIERGERFGEISQKVAC
jgi:translation initiation factor eIF-2B subunit alpha